MSWIEKIKIELSDEAMDFSSEATILLGIFRRITAPEVGAYESQIKFLITFLTLINIIW